MERSSGHPSWLEVPEAADGTGSPPPRGEGFADPGPATISVPVPAAEEEDRAMRERLRHQGSYPEARPPPSTSSSSDGELADPPPPFPERLNDEPPPSVRRLGPAPPAAPPKPPLPRTGLGGALVPAARSDGRETPPYRPPARRSPPDYQHALELVAESDAALPEDDEDRVASTESSEPPTVVLTRAQAVRLTTAARRAARRAAAVKAARTDDEAAGRRALLEIATVRRDLLHYAGDGRPGSFADLERYVRTHVGAQCWLNEPLAVRLVIGETEPPYYDLRRIRRYSPGRRSAGLLVLGRLFFGLQPSPLARYTVIYTGGARVYVHSEGSDFLYVVADGGVRGLLEHGGYRYVYEAFARPIGLDPALDALIPSAMRGLARARDLDQVLEWLRRHRGVSTFRVFWDEDAEREAHRALEDDTSAYLVLGDEKALGLSDELPGRLFECLREAGLYVLGRGELQSVLVVDGGLHVYVVLNRGRLMLVAPSIVGLLRDRLRRVFRTAYRRSYAPDGSETAEMGASAEVPSGPRPLGDVNVVGPRLCVGQVCTFPCDVGYVMPGSDQLARVLRTGEEPYFSPLVGLMPQDVRPAPPLATVAGPDGATWLECRDPLLYRVF